MATVHNFTIKISEIRVRYFLIVSEVIVENFTANPQVTIVEGVRSGPTLRSELLSSQDESMVHAKSE
jgi:hypothetical protein